jgi:alkanesulfonate monooxygenase SsuD/methylene tetrahydromethanopterin reductase-like flavin-dependent oxidoreductase (luciferase family)
MDLMLKGRAAWNIVTSLNDAEGANFGRDEHMGHDARYDRADEFMDVVLGHWNSWDENALILDKRITGSPIRPRCIGLIMRAGIFDHAARSACRGRRKGIRC